MLRHLLIGFLIGLLASSGCAGPRIVVRTDRGQEVRVDPSKVHPVEYKEEDLREALKPYADLIAELSRQHDGQLRIHLTSAVLPGADAADLAFVEEYLSWCGVARGQPGDCVNARDPRMPGLTIDGKRGIALRMAFSSAMHEAAEVIRGINPLKIEAMMLMWFAFYLASFVFPDPVTKLLDVILTANLIAFIGVDGFHNVIEGYLDMRKDAADAKDFAALHEAGMKYGRRLGPSMLRIVTALITLGLAAKAGMGAAAEELPGGEIAAMNAQALGFDLATVSGGSVAVSASGTVTLVVGAEAVVVSAAMSGTRPAPMRKVGDILESLADVFANPRLLLGKTPAELLSRLSGGLPKGWRIETLGKGSQSGKGFILREYTESGARTGRMIQWHPGGGHHGPSPYWKVSSPETGTVRIGPQF